MGAKELHTTLQNKHNSTIIYTYIYMTHYRSLISILSTCKYATSYHIMPCHLSPLKNISEN
jgi:recombinational DNA repair protein RecR